MSISKILQKMQSTSQQLKIPQHFSKPLDEGVASLLFIPQVESCVRMAQEKWSKNKFSGFFKFMTPV